MKNDGFVKSPTSIRQAIRQAHGPEQGRRNHGPEQSRRAVLRCILRHCSVLYVRLIPQDLRALNLELFTLSSIFNFLRDR